MRQPGKRYLFIRMLEACNADCFMCGYALSRDAYRFTLAEFKALLPEAIAANVGFIRLTGGEPLMHQELMGIISAGREAGAKMSLITNGLLLPRRLEQLADSGLAQVIVSVDGASAGSHDRYRNIAGLFDKAVEGIRMAGRLDIMTRVNSVVGPHNYGEMPILQRLLGDWGVKQWELSAIKLDRPVEYTDPDDVRAVCDPIYRPSPDGGPVPMGKRFYGETLEEQRLFFELGVTPRPTPPLCHLAGDVIYLDTKAGRGFACSLLPHRHAKESGGGSVLRTEAGWNMRSAAFADHVGHFRREGPRVCSGCSPTAAGYSDRAATMQPTADWSF